MHSQQVLPESYVTALRQHSFCTQTLHKNHPAKALLDALPDFFEKAAAEGVPDASPQDILSSGLEARGHVRLAPDKRVYIVRDNQHLPVALPVAEAWGALFELALQYLASIEADTSWPRGTLAGLVQGSSALPHAPVETLMRLFCYTARSANHDDGCRLEPHVDRGVLTLVLSDTEGLGVIGAGDGIWRMPRVRSRWIFEPMLSVLVGETLHYVSNQRFPRCIHGVAAGRHRRYSVVFQLRPRLDALIDSDRLTTEKTGRYSPPICESVETFETRQFAQVRSVNYTE